MANRRLYQFRYSYERDLVDIYGTITITGSSGAVDSYTGKGIASVTKESTAGQYTIALTDSFNLLMSMDAVTLNATGISATPSLGIITNSVNSAAAPLITVQFSAAGSATNPAASDVIYFHICCRNAST